MSAFNIFAIDDSWYGHTVIHPIALSIIGNTYTYLQCYKFYCINIISSKAFASKINGNNLNVFRRRHIVLLFLRLTHTIEC